MKFLKIENITNFVNSRFDEHQIGALTEKVSAYMDRIKEGTDDKLIVFLQGFFNLVAGIGVGFYMK